MRFFSQKKSTLNDNNNWYKLHFRTKIMYTLENEVFKSENAFRINFIWNSFFFSLAQSKIDIILHNWDSNWILSACNSRQRKKDSDFFGLFHLYRVCCYKRPNLNLYFQFFSYALPNKIVKVPIFLRFSNFLHIILR